jgi:REP element-mobilizing transposase RayT
MAIARKRIINRREAGYYLLTNRCVRQAFSLGSGPVDEFFYYLRKKWIEELILFLSSIFMNDLINFNVMDNHMHLITFFDPERVLQLSDIEVAQLVLALDVKSPQRKTWDSSKRAKWIQDFISDRCRVNHWREALCDPSKFMAYLDEVIARRCNKEDGYKGHFWQGRFHSVKLKDPGALLMTMLYVDLNTVRAGAAVGVEDSRHSAIAYRLRAAQVLSGGPNELDIRSRRVVSGMCAIEGMFEVGKLGVKPLRFDQYLKLVKEQVRQHHELKQSRYSEAVGRRYGLKGSLQQAIESVDGQYHYRIGSVKHLREDTRKNGSRWCWGMKASRSHYLEE